MDTTKSVAELLEEWRAALRDPNTEPFGTEAQAAAEARAVRAPLEYQDAVAGQHSLPDDQPKAVSVS